MATKTAGFSVSISAVDPASATLDRVNKRIAALSAPAERFNRALSKFGDVTGVSRVTEGMGALAHNALDAFRAVDRISGPLAAITGVGSVAGMTALVNKWADLGTQVAQTSYRLNASPAALSRLERAGSLAGASVRDVDEGLQGLQRSLANASYHGDVVAIRTFEQLGIAYKDASGHARNAADVIGEVADATQRQQGGTAQAHLLERLGMPANLVSLLKNGRKGLEEFEAKADSLGGTLTDEMAKNADKTRQSFEALSEAVEGVGNRLANRLSPTVTKYMDLASDWIAKNKETADSVGEIATKAGLAGAGIFGLGRLFGWSALGAAATSPLGAGAVIAGAGAAAGAMNMPMVDDFGRVTGNWGGRSEEGNPAFASGRLPSIFRGRPSLLRNDDQARVARVRDRLASDLGITKEQSAGIVSNLYAESGLRGVNEANPAPGTRGGFGWAQWTGSRRAEYERWASLHGLDPASDEANYQYLVGDLRGRHSRILQDVRNAPNATAAAGAFFPCESGGDAALTRDHLADHVGNADRIAGLPAQAASAHLTVKFENAPPGTTARIETRGPLTASAPRIETPLAMAR